MSTAKNSDKLVQKKKILFNRFHNNREQHQTLQNKGSLPVLENTAHKAANVKVYHLLAWMEYDCKTKQINYGKNMNLDLQINLAKAKEMSIDFWRSKHFVSSSSAPAPCVIKGEPVTVVQQYKYPDTVPELRCDHGWHI